MKKSCPLSGSFDDIRKCAFRVIYYKNRIAVEFFHALTDGNGGLIFLKTLVAEYLTEKYGESIPNTDGVLDRLEEPSADELEDSFLKYSGPVSLGRNEKTAYKFYGTENEDGFNINTTLMMNADEVHKAAHSYGVTVTAFLAAAMIKAVLNIQEERVKDIRRRMPVSVLIPVNLRPLYGSTSLRNFVLYTTPAVNPRLGDYTFREICDIVYYQMKLDVTPKQMSMRIATNVNDERKLILKLMPLFVKNLAMKAVFNVVGERKSCFSFSNLGL